jgi:mannose-6-phosphate isomerase-like protein (cupin superfamily)
MGTRIVVTGQRADGKSVIVSDRVLAPSQAGIGVTPLWAADEAPRFPISGEAQPAPTMFPPLGGYRFIMMTIPPDAQKGEPIAGDGMGERARVGTGAGDWMEPDGSGFHTTDTVDFEVVVSGEASQEFDDGQIVHLKAGDCFVQNGTRHRWFNRGTEPAVVACILIGGEPRAK